MLSLAELCTNGLPSRTVAAGDLNTAAEAFPLTDELRNYLQTEVTQRRCQAKQVARLRMVERRTLSRWLQAEGTTFRQLANEAQFRVAKKLLTDTDMSLTQNSTALNFSAPSAFSHAFRRWSGMTPSAWRQVNQPDTTRDEHHENPRPCPDGEGAAHHQAGSRLGAEGN